MEYCGAGSVSDIIRLRNKTVSFFQECITLIEINYELRLEARIKVRVTRQDLG